MSRAKRPLNMAADEALYAKYENEPRPNALYNADGTRRKLSGTDPQQEDLRREWTALYAANGGALEGPTPPPKPCDDPNQPCSITKTVTAKIVSLTFRSDHLDGTGGKLLRPSAGDFIETGRTGLIKYAGGRMRLTLVSLRSRLREDRPKRQLPQWKR